MINNGRLDLSKYIAYPQKKLKNSEESIIVERGQHGIVTNRMDKYLQKVDRDMMRAQMKRLYLEQHPEVKPDLEFKHTLNHLPMAPQDLTGVVAYRYPKEYNEYLGIQAKRSRMKRRITEVGKLAVITKSFQKDGLRASKMSREAASTDRSSSVISKFTAKENVTNTSNRNYTDQNSLNKEPQITKKISPRRNRSSHLPLKKPKIKDRFKIPDSNNTSISSQQNKAGVDDYIYLPKSVPVKDSLRVLVSELHKSNSKRNKTVLGRFVTEVDHSEMVSGTDYFGVTASYMDQWRKVTLADTVHHEQNVLELSIEGSKRTRSSYATGRSRVGQVALNNSSWISDLRKNFFKNVESGNRDANLKYDRHFHLGFQDMRKKESIKFQTFDEITDYYFLRRRKMNNADFQRTMDGFVLDKIDKSLSRASTAAAKLRGHGEDIASKLENEANLSPGKKAKASHRVSFMEGTQTSWESKYSSPMKRSIIKKSSPLRKRDFQSRDQNTSRLSEARSSAFREPIIDALAGKSQNDGDDNISLAGSISTSPVRDSSPASKRFQVVEPDRDLSESKAKRIGSKKIVIKKLEDIHNIGPLIENTRSLLRKVYNSKGCNQRILEEKNKILKESLLIRERDCGLKRSIQSKLITQNIQSKDGYFAQLRKQSEKERTNNYKDPSYIKFMQFYKSQLIFLQQQLSHLNHGADTLCAVFDYFKILLTEGILPTAQDGLIIDRFIKKSQTEANFSKLEIYTCSQICRFINELSD